MVQRSTGYIIAGNHTYLGARKLGWTHLDTVTIEVNDKAARKIMLADNKTSDAGQYDDAVLAEVLRSLEGDIEGTGYYDEEIDSILSGAQKAAQDTMDDLGSRDLQQRFNDAPLGSEDEEEILKNEPGPADASRAELAGGLGISEEDEEEGPSIEGGADQLPGMLTLKMPHEVDFPKVGYWQLTELDQSRFVRFEELPEKLVTWAESFSRNKVDPHANDPDTWWFYNWGMSSTNGMDDISKVIVSFYSPDTTFENWWVYPDRYVAKLLNSRIKYVVTPDFSMVGSDARVIHLHQLYRQRWLARYIQEAGISVIPNVSAPPGKENLKFLRDYVLATLPVGLPMIAKQMQTFSQEDIDTVGLDVYIEHHQTIFDVLKPKGFLLYAGKPGQEFYRNHIKTNCPVRVLDSRLMRLSEFDTQRKRKKTI